MKIHKPSPIAHARVRLFSAPPNTCVDVRFNTKEEVDALINALVMLKDSSGNNPNHIHLQDFGLNPISPIGSTEVIFHRPRKKPDDAEQSCLDAYTAYVKQQAEKQDSQQSGPAYPPQGVGSADP
jgi:hypothetical protein